MADVARPCFTQGMLAEALRVSPRYIRMLEAQGLPTLGKHGRERLYPLHAVRWYVDKALIERHGPWGYAPLPAEDYEK